MDALNGRIGAQHHVNVWRRDQDRGVVPEPALSAGVTEARLGESSSDTIDNRQFSADRSRRGDGVPFWRVHN